MTTITCTDKLDKLTDYLGGLTSRASVGTLRELLDELDVGVDDVRPYCRFSDRHYVRNLVHAGRWHHLLVLCWKSGQRSPIHNHARSTCGFKILRGVMTETLFEATPSRLLKPVSSRDLVEGHVGANQDDDVHQVSNLQAAESDLISLHIYSPPLLRMDTYSLLDSTVGQFTPTFFEHVHGSGI